MSKKATRELALFQKPVTSPVDVLKRVKTLFEKYPHRWTRGMMGAPRGCKHCAIGAVRLASGVSPHGADNILASHARFMLRQALTDDIIEVNDGAYGRQRIIAGLKKAISAAEKNS